MKDKELLEEYLKDESKYLIEDNEGNLINITKKVQEAFLAGFKAGKPQWHKVADGDLPNCEHGHTVFNQDLDRVIIRNGRFEYLDGCPTKVVAWCEIPQYTDKE